MLHDRPYQVAGMRVTAMESYSHFDIFYTKRSIILGADTGPKQDWTIYHFYKYTTVKSDPEAPAACVAMRRAALRGTVSLIKYIISKFPWYFYVTIPIIIS